MTPPPAGFGPEDQAALDALLENGFDLSRVPGPQRDRAAAIGRLLGLLEVTPASGDLVDRTVERVRAASVESITLSPADQRAIDHLAESGWDLDGVASSHRTRARQALRLLDELRVEGVTGARAAEIADRTMELIAAAERRAWAVSQHELTGSRRGFRLADLGSIAAMVLIGVAIFWPVIGGVRASVERKLCEQNMHNAGVGFGLHASDRAGALPMSQASLLRLAPGLVTWWDVGTPERSHSANLFELAAGGYASLGDLACPGNHAAPVVSWGDARDWRSADEVSYSYQLFGGPRAPQLTALGRAVLMTDKSPVVERARRGERIYAEERSHNHGGAGQQVLFADGSVEWLTRPVTDSGDNLWLPAALSGLNNVHLRGAELPASPGDAFVGP